MRDEERDERIARLLGAVRAEAEPALWTRVCTRIEERERAQPRGWVAWLMRPAALGGSLAMLGIALIASAALVVTAPRSLSTTAAESLEDALVAELESHAAASGAAAGVRAPGIATDSGASR